MRLSIASVASVEVRTASAEEHTVASAEVRTVTRLAVPSKGRMAEDTLDLLKVRDTRLLSSVLIPSI